MNAAQGFSSNSPRESVSVVICAAGKGSRAGFAKNKLLMPYPASFRKHAENSDSFALTATLPPSFFGNSSEITVLEKTISAFDFNEIDQILVTSSKEDFSEISAICAKFPRTEAILGGETRFLSVYRALEKTTGKIVLIHDGARPNVSLKTISECIASVRQYGSGICALPAVDTTAIANDKREISSVPLRQNVYALQTPQGFYSDEIISAYKRAYEGGRVTFTDDSSVFAAYIRAPRLCEGERENAKLTYAEDFASFPLSLSNTVSKESKRIGFGVDTHAFGKEQNFIVLAGVKIPSESGLIAHSDGDVLVHAVMDALLSAAGLKDIGHYFPDKDEKWKNADSMEMLKAVMEYIGEEGFAAKNLSVAIQAERPRLAAYIDFMRQALAEALDLPTDAIGISAGTNEGLGYIGEGKGITVYACTLLKRKQV